MELLKFHGIPWNFYSRCGDSMEFHEIWCWHQVPWSFQSSMEFHGTSLLTWKSSMELRNIDINKFHNWGSVFHCFSYDFMSLYNRQSISSWNIDIFQFQSNFLVPLILVEWRYSILNGGLFELILADIWLYDVVVGQWAKPMIAIQHLLFTYGNMIWKYIKTYLFVKNLPKFNILLHSFASGYQICRGCVFIAIWPILHPQARCCQTAFMIWRDHIWAHFVLFS